MAIIIIEFDVVYIICDFAVIHNFAPEIRRFFRSSCPLMLTTLTSVSQNGGTFYIFFQLLSLLLVPFHFSLLFFVFIFIAIFVQFVYVCVFLYVFRVCLTNIINLVCLHFVCNVGVVVGVLSTFFSSHFFTSFFFLENTQR